jgi:hypothetical protein
MSSFHTGETFPFFITITKNKIYEFSLENNLLLVDVVFLYIFCVVLEMKSMMQRGTQSVKFNQS